MFCANDFHNLCREDMSTQLCGNSRSSNIPIPCKKNASGTAILEMNVDPKQGNGFSLDESHVSNNLC